LVRRAFRAVSIAHGRRMVISIGLPVPRRTVLLDQEEFDAGMPAFADFHPASDLVAEAAEFVRRIRAGEVSFARPRDLRLTRRRAQNLVPLPWRSTGPPDPGAPTTYPPPS